MVKELFSISLFIKQFCNIIVSFFKNNINFSHFPVSLLFNYSNHGNEKLKETNSTLFIEDQTKALQTKQPNLLPTISYPPSVPPLQKDVTKKSPKIKTRGISSPPVIGVEAPSPQEISVVTFKDRKFHKLAGSHMQPNTWGVIDGKKIKDSERFESALANGFVNHQIVKKGENYKIKPGGTGLRALGHEVKIEDDELYKKLKDRGIKPHLIIFNKSGKHDKMTQEFATR